MASAHTLEHCIFCRGADMSEEHVVADWALRAFMRSRRAEGGLAGTFVAADALKVEVAEPVNTAKVTCTGCNNGWLSQVDQAAARVLKPLIRGENAATLDAVGQSAFAAWIFKCALIFDAAQHGRTGELASLRASFMASRRAPPGCVIYAGPAGAPLPVEFDGAPKGVGLRLFGVRTVSGVVRLKVDVAQGGAEVTEGEYSEIPIPGYQVMLGSLCAYLGGQVPPISAASLEGFVQVWPAWEEPVVVTPWLVGEPAS
jgi:hypothetical protein